MTETKRKVGRPKTKYGWKIILSCATYHNDVWVFNNSRTLTIDAETKEEALRIAQDHATPEKIFTIGDTTYRISAEGIYYGAENIGKVHYYRAKEYLK